MAKVLDFKFTDNKADVEAALKEKVYAWLEAIGEDAASTSAKFAPVDTGRLKNSISSAVNEQEQVVYIGTPPDIHYAIYHEFGTGKYASGGGGRSTPWAYQDEKTGEWRWTAGVPARHFLQFGCTAHTEQYKQMLEAALKR